MTSAQRAHTASAATRASLGATTLLSVFFRSLLIQATWNRAGMQNLGFAFALWPALRQLFADEDARRRALERHLGFFNTHPYMAAAILGASLRREQQVARGEADEGAAPALKDALQGPFAAIGDGFFWTGLRPCLGALAVLLFATTRSPWAVLPPLALYNLVHLGLRVLLFTWGWRKGEAMIAAVGRLRLPALGNALRAATAGLLGATFAAILWPSALVPAGTTLTQRGTALAAALLGYGALRLWAKLYAVFYVGMVAVLAATAWIASSQGRILP